MTPVTTGRTAVHQAAALAPVPTPAPPPGLHLVDTSALMRVRHPSVRAALRALIDEGLAATCVTVDLEVGYSGRSAADAVRIGSERSARYVNRPISEVVAGRARDVLARMAARGHHRAAGVVDLLTAAVAEHHRAVVLHYDSDFEHIAATTGQPHQWIAPRGSLP